MDETKEQRKKERKRERKKKNRKNYQRKKSRLSQAQGHQHKIYIKNQVLVYCSHLIENTAHSYITKSKPQTWKLAAGNIDSIPTWFVRTENTRRQQGSGKQKSSSVRYNLWWSRPRSAKEMQKRRCWHKPSLLLPPLSSLQSCLPWAWDVHRVTGLWENSSPRCSLFWLPVSRSTHAEVD